MARADLLLDLVTAEKQGDRERFKVLVESVIAEERAKHYLKLLPQQGKVARA